MNFTEVITEDAGEVKYLYYSLVNNGIEAKVEKAYGSKAYIGMNYSDDGIRIVIKPSGNKGDKVDGSTYSKVASKVKSDIMKIVRDEGLRGYSVSSDDEAIWVS